jgi:hypothetical protein
MSPDDHRALLEYVGNVVDEQLHDLDPARVQGRARLCAMLTRCRQLTELDDDPLFGEPPNVFLILRELLR